MRQYHSELGTLNYKEPNTLGLLESNGDMGTIEFEGRVIGPMTTNRRKYLTKICKNLSWRESCHHEWDCCGCVFEERYQLVRRGHQYFIEFRQYRNY